MINLTLDLAGGSGGRVCSYFASIRLLNWLHFNAGDNIDAEKMEPIRQMVSESNGTYLVGPAKHRPQHFLWDFRATQGDLISRF